jgi:hypothetical protein
LWVFENRVLRKIIVPKKEITGGCKKLHAEERYNSYYSPDIIEVIKSWSIRCMGAC